MTAARFRGEASRLEVVEVGRRRRWSAAEKVRIVEESLAGPRRVSATARRHGISRSRLTEWRRAYREGRLAGAAEPAFVPVRLRDEAPPAAASEVGGGAGRIEIVLAGGRRVVVGADVDAAALARVVDVLERR
ncbi:MAG: IS66-like element accessory protein TnpA [Alphaproteobacteria bacterium]